MYTHPSIRRARLLPPVLFVALLISVAADAATVQDIVSQVSESRYAAFHREGLYTHNGADRMYGPQHDLARANIVAMLEGFGLHTTLDPFTYQGSTYYNVVAELPGRVDAGQVYIIGAHYDSVGNPGADDNASGVAGVVEAARILSKYQLDATVRFIAFDREEQGMIGSDAYVSAHAAEDIRGMISMDMIAYNAEHKNQCLIHGRTASDVIKNSLAAAISSYGNGLSASVGGDDPYSDHAPFEAAGKPACMLIEDYRSNPNYHKAADSVDTPNYIDYQYATNMTRSVVGYLATSASLLPDSQWNGSGEDNRWTTGGNWSGSVPSSPAAITFGAVTPAGHAANYNDAIGAQFNGITFTADAPAYELQGEAIKLGGDVVNLSGNGQTIALALELVDDGVLFDTGEAGIAISGTISGKGLTKSGTGVLTLSGSSTHLGPTTVKGGTLVVSSGTVATLNVPAGAAALNAGASATLANVSGTGQLVQNGAIGALRVTGGTVTTGAGATVTTADLTGGRLDTQGNYLSVGAKITMPAGQPMASIAKSDSATPFGIKGSDLGATNIGGLQLNGGTVTISGPAGAVSVLDQSSTAGTGTGTFSQSVTVSPGADVMAVTVSTYTAPSIDSWSLSFGGQPLARAVYKLSNNTTTITSAIFYLVNPTPGTATLSGTFTGASVSVVDYCTLDGVNTSAALITGNDDSNGSITNVTLDGIVPGSVAVVGQALRQGSGTFPITTTATSGIAGNLPSGTSGNVIGAGGYVTGLANGSTTFTGTLSGYTNNRHPLTVAVFAPGPVPWEISQPGIDVEVTAPSTLDFGGASAVTLGDLTMQSDATLSLVDGSSVAFSSLAGPSTSALAARIPLTLSGGNMAGNIAGTGSLIKAGTGTTFILSGDNTYSGGTAVTGGTLQITAVHGLPPGGSLTIAEGGTVVLASGLSVGGGGVAVAATVPEPSTLALLVIGALGCAWRRRGRK